MPEDGSPQAAMGPTREILEMTACDGASDESSSFVRGGCLHDNPNCKAHHLLPGIQNPGLRSSSWKSKSSIFSRSCPCRPEKFEIRGDSAGFLAWWVSENFLQKTRFDLYHV
jgi:hypothetical protein